MNHTQLTSVLIDASRIYISHTCLDRHAVSKGIG